MRLLFVVTLAAGAAFGQCVPEVNPFTGKLQCKGVKADSSGNVTIGDAVPIPGGAPDGSLAATKLYGDGSALTGLAGGGDMTAAAYALSGAGAPSNPCATGGSTYRNTSAPTQVFLCDGNGGTWRGPFAILAGSSGQVAYHDGTGYTTRSGLAFNSTFNVLGVLGGYTAGQTGGSTGTYKINGGTSGVVTITGASAAGTWNLTLPTSGGSNGQVLSTNGSGVTSWLTLGTIAAKNATATGGRCAQWSADGTSLDSAADACGTGGGGSLNVRLDGTSVGDATALNIQTTASVTPTFTVADSVATLSLAVASIAPATCSISAESSKACTHNLGTLNTWVACYEGADGTGPLLGSDTATTSVTRIFPTSTSVTTITFSGSTTALCKISTGGMGPKGDTGATGPAGSGSGDVLGPATNSDGYLPQWSGANSKTLGNGKAAPSGAVVGTTDAQAITNKDFTGTNTWPTFNQSTSGTAAGLSGSNFSGDVTNSGNTITLASAYKVRPCEIAIGDPGSASSALADDNDTPAVCGNLTGATMTITEVKCMANTNTGSPAVLPIITGGAANSILSGAIACGNGVFGSAGTLNGTPTQADGATIDANISTAGGTAKYIVIRIKRTL